MANVVELHHYLAALIKSSSTRLPSIAVVVAAKGVVASLVAVVWVVPFRSLHVHRSAYPFHPRARDLKYTYRFLHTQYERAGGKIRESFEQLKKFTNKLMNERTSERTSVLLLLICCTSHARNNDDGMILLESSTCADSLLYSTLVSDVVCLLQQMERH